VQFYFKKLFLLCCFQELFLIEIACVAINIISFIKSMSPSLSRSHEAAPLESVFHLAQSFYFIYKLIVAFVHGKCNFSIVTDGMPEIYSGTFKFSCHCFSLPHP